MAGDGDPNSTSFTLHNESIEDPEELEERKKREEEMHNLISHAMGQFDFDELSSRNSSIINYEDKNEPPKTSETLQEEYYEANPKEQLAILYKIRIKEIDNLNKELEQLKLEYNKQQNGLKRQITLLEIENQRKSVTLKESQNLVVEKVEEIHQLNERMDTYKNTVNDLEFKLKELNDENRVLRQLNTQFEQEKVLLERDFPLKSKIVDKEFQESQRIKIDHLENSLHKAKEEINHNNQQYKQLEEELKRNICNRDNELVQKNLLLNTLTEKNEELLNKYQECLKIIDEQKGKLSATNNKGQHLEREFQKIRENERLEMLSKEIRADITSEFEKQILTLNSENKKLRNNLQYTEAELAETRRNLDIMSNLEKEKHDFENKLGKLHHELNEVSVERATLGKKLRQCEQEKVMLESQQSRFIAESQLAKVLKLENENLQKKIIDLEVENARDEHSVQTSFPFVNNADYLNNQEQLLTAHNRILVLENQIKQLQDENSQLQVKVGLEQEREGLIRKLQEKAAEFQRVIQKKQKTKEMASVGTNTTNENNNSVLKLKHDTLLYQTEAKLHQKLKKEFDDKLMQAVSDFKSSYKCKKCQQVREECKKLNSLRQEDRDAVLNLVTLWEAKFLQFEKDVEEERNHLMNAKAQSEDVLQLKQLLANYKDRYKQTVELLEQQTGGVMQSQKETNIRNYSVLSKRIKKLQSKIQWDNERIRAIQQSLENSNKK